MWVASLSSITLTAVLLPDETESHPVKQCSAGMILQKVSPSDYDILWMETYLRLSAVDMEDPSLIQTSEAFFICGK